MKTKKIITIVLSFMICVVSLIGCAGKSNNPYGVSDEEMAKVRTFIGRETNNDNEYYVIRQDGYGRIQEWNVYSEEDDSLTANIDFAYSGYIIVEQTVTSHNGEILIDRFYTLDDQGKVLTQNMSLDGEISQTRFFKEDDGSEIAEEDFGVCFVKYDELGRIVSWREKNPPRKKY